MHALNVRELCGRLNYSGDFDLKEKRPTICLRICFRLRSITLFEASGHPTWLENITYQRSSRKLTAAILQKNTKDI